MNSILLLGDAQNHTFRNALLPVLERYGGVLYVGERQIFRLIAEKPAFFVYDCERMPELHLDRGLLLFTGSCPQTAPILLPSGICSILESGNQQAAALLQNSKSPVVTCGMSTKDTLSVASVEEDGAVLSLQRNVSTLDGRLVEPHDFRVSFRAGMRSQQLLSISMILLLCGVDSGNGYQL